MAKIFDDITEEAIKLGVKNGMKAVILLVRQIKLVQPNATIDEVLDIIVKSYEEAYKGV